MRSQRLRRLTLFSRPFSLGFFWGRPGGGLTDIFSARFSGCSHTAFLDVEYGGGTDGEKGGSLSLAAFLGRRLGDAILLMPLRLDGNILRYWLYARLNGHFLAAFTDALYEDREEALADFSFLISLGRTFQGEKANGEKKEGNGRGGTVSLETVSPANVSAGRSGPGPGSDRTEGERVRKEIVCRRVSPGDSKPEEGELPARGIRSRENTLENTLDNTIDNTIDKTLENSVENPFGKSLWRREALGRRRDRLTPSRDVPAGGEFPLKTGLFERPEDAHSFLSGLEPPRPSELFFGVFAVEEGVKLRTPRMRRAARFFRYVARSLPLLFLALLCAAAFHSGCQALKGKMYGAERAALLERYTKDPSLLFGDPESAIFEEEGLLPRLNVLLPLLRKIDEEPLSFMGWRLCQVTSVCIGSKEEGEEEVKGGTEGNGRDGLTKEAASRKGLSLQEGSLTGAEERSLPPASFEFRVRARFLRTPNARFFTAHEGFRIDAGKEEMEHVRRISLAVPRRERGTLPLKTALLAALMNEKNRRGLRLTLSEVPQRTKEIPDIGVFRSPFLALKVSFRGLGRATLLDLAATLPAHCGGAVYLKSLGFSGGLWDMDLVFLALAS
ncbi:MAG: hypothetical protein K5657_07830 [Desulfovibrio sp.]|nr:hypothetical protein [Desulfovibrio sp.]